MSTFSAFDEIKKPKATSLPKDMGDTGLNRLSINEADFLRAFKGQTKYKTIERMLKNEPLIGALDFAISKMIKQVDWKIEGDEASQENIDFISGALFKDMSQSWDELLEEILTFPSYGFSAHEIVYKIRAGMNKNKPSLRSRFDDGRWGWRKMPIRAQGTITRWVYDPKTKDLAGIEQTTTGTGYATQRVFIPIEKMLLFRTGAYADNPEGESVYRSAYIPFYYKEKLQNIQAIGIERNLDGLPFMRVPGDIMTESASTDEKATFAMAKDIVRNLRNDEQHGVVLPSDVDPETQKYLYDLQLMSSSSSKAIDVEQPIARYSREILMPVMADFILLGHESVGSFALSSSKTKMFSVAISNFMEEISEVFNRHAIPRLIRLNKMEAGGFPVLTHGDVETEDLVALSTMVKQFTESGIDLSDQEDNLRRRAGLKERTTSKPMGEILENDVPNTDNDNPDV